MTQFLPCDLQLRDHHCPWLLSSGPWKCCSMRALWEALQGWETGCRRLRCNGNPGNVFHFSWRHEQKGRAWVTCQSRCPRFCSQNFRSYSLLFLGRTCLLNVNWLVWDMWFPTSSPAGSAAFKPNIPHHCAHPHGNKKEAWRNQDCEP